MDDQNNGNQTEGKPTENNADEGGFSNADWKAHPLTNKLTAELNQYREREQKRIAEQEKAQKEAEIKNLADKERFDEAVKLYENRVAEMETAHKAELLKRDLGFELAKAGFNNDTFIKGAISSFDSEKFETPTAYVDALKSDENNKMFLSAFSKSLPPEPGKPGLSGNAPLSKEKIRAMQQSSNKEDRDKVRQYLKDYFARNNKLPDVLST